MPVPSFVRALRHRNFRLFISGQAISLVGTWMQSVAQSWLVYRLTRAAGPLGLVGFAGQIPVFLLSPVAGVVADRRDRRRILVGTQSSAMLLAFVLGALTLAHRVDVPLIIAMAACLGTVTAFDVPTRQSFVVEMVGPSDLVNAIALNSSMVNAARLIGPSLAGMVVALVGEGWCFIANGASYLAVIAGLALMRVPPRAPAPATGTTAASTLSRLGEGFVFAARTPPVRLLLVLIGVASLVGMPYTVLMPVFADRVLHGGAGALGVLMGAAGAGALGGAVLLATREGVLGLGRWIVTAAGAFGLALVAFSFSSRMWLSCACLFGVGFAMMVQMAATNTLLQSMTPDRLRGRVMAIYSMMFVGMSPFGALAASALADRFGAPHVVAASGLVCTCAAIVAATRLAGVRAEGHRLIAAQQAALGDGGEGSR